MRVNVLNKLQGCPICDSLHTGDEWDKATLSMCNNREMRRTFIPFSSSRGMHISKKSQYKCPNCNKYVYRIHIKESYLDDDEIIKTR